MKSLKDNWIKGRLPLEPQWIKTLKQGDMVKLSGPLYAFRDAVHKKLAEMLEKGDPLPIELKGQTVYYMAPSPAPPGRVIGSAGPTTSGRMDPFTPLLMEKGLLGMIGKGPRSIEVKNAIVKHGGIYFAAPSGAGAYLSGAVKKISVAAFPRLEPEALMELYVEDLPVFVAIDSAGGDYYQTAKEKYGAPKKDAPDSQNV